MRVLVTGVKGQLGHDVLNELINRKHNAIGVDIAEMDITDYNAVENKICASNLDAVIHCAAWTEVDAAEEKENIPRVMKINVDGTRNIAEACKKCNCKIMYISTDYVFNGQGDIPWKPECRNFSPLNIYGMSKLGGEEAVRNILNRYFIVRISWAFGKNGNNFVKTMLKLSKSHDSLKVVNDQIGTPTYTLDLSRLLVDMIETDKYGYYNATNEGGYISWADFASEIFRKANKTTKVIPVTTLEYGFSKAKRPLNSRLDKSKLLANGFNQLPVWQDALDRYLQELKDNE